MKPLENDYEQKFRVSAERDAVTLCAHQIHEFEGEDERGFYYHYLIVTQENGKRILVEYDDAGIPSVSAVM